MIALALCCDRVELICQWLSWLNVAALEHNRCIAEDEVYGACDVAFAVELAVGVGVESVLIGVKRAPVEDGLVGAGPECHRLVFFWTCSVCETYVLGYETLSLDSCNNKPSFSSHCVYKRWQRYFQFQVLFNFKQSFLGFTW